VFQAPPAARHQSSVQVFPGLPDPNSGKIYHLQVGAFSTPEGAAATAQRIRNAGFYVGGEASGGTYRVIVVNIPASVVYLAVQKLASLGFGQIWVREQGPAR
jgi:hypothetical protein